VLEPKKPSQDAWGRQRAGLSGLQAVVCGNSLRVCPIGYRTDGHDQAPKDRFPLANADILGKAAAGSIGICGIEKMRAKAKGS
jgi:hypothetical protein